MRARRLVCGWPRTAALAHLRHTRSARHGVTWGHHTFIPANMPRARGLPAQPPCILITSQAREAVRKWQASSLPPEATSPPTSQRDLSEKIHERDLGAISPEEGDLDVGLAHGLVRIVGDLDHAR